LNKSFTKTLFLMIATLAGTP